MKLFIWEGDGVLQDYTSGMIVAMAPDLETALETIKGICSHCMGSFPMQPTEIVDLGTTSEPVTPSAWLTWGGG